MKILCITNMYPGSEIGKISKGIFVKEQVDLLRTSKDIGEVRVLNIDRFSVIYKYFFSSFKIMWECLRFRPNVIHIHYGLTFLPVIFAMPFARKARLIVTFHGSDLLGSNRIVRFISRIAHTLSDRTVIVNEAMGSQLKNVDKVSIVPCSVNDDFFKVKRKENGGKKPVIIFPSDPERREKNYPYFLRVVKLMKDSGADFDVAIMKGMTRNEVLTLFAVGAVLILTSDREGSPQVVKEALASGLPVISRKVGDLVELSKRTSGLIMADDEGAMAKYALEVMNNNETCLSDRATVSKVYGGERVLKQLLDLYR